MAVIKRSDVERFALRRFVCCTHDEPSGRHTDQLLRSRTPRTMLRDWVQFKGVHGDGDGEYPAGVGVNVDNCGIPAGTDFI